MEVMTLLDLPKISEVADWLTNGIFSSFTNVPWRSDEAPALNVLYLSRSGDKYIAPIVRLMLDSSGKLTPANMGKLAGYLETMYSQNWQKLYATLNFEYDPISNYDMTESSEDSRQVNETTEDANTTSVEYNESLTGDNTQTRDLKTTDTGTVATTDDTETSGTNDLTKGGSVKDDTSKTVNTTNNTTENTTNSGSDNVFGYNSTSAVPSTSTSDTGETTTNTTGENTETGSSTTTYNTTDTTTTSETVNKSVDETRNLSNTDTGTITTESTDTKSGTSDTKNTGNSTKTSTDTNTHTLTRKGNIGVTTSQQMIQSERDLWAFQFYDRVFSDIDKLLTIPVY